MSNFNNYKMVEILVVEDEEDHSRLIIKTLQSLGQLKNKITLAENGQEALDYLLKEGKYVDAKHENPMLILLDIKMPLKNGFEVLEIIKKNKKLKLIPIVMLSTASNSEDIEKALELGANDYITKPVKFEDFRLKVNSLGYYWGIISDSKRVIE
jgi:CheY-like chemotaxis protein